MAKLPPDTLTKIFKLLQQIAEEIENAYVEVVGCIVVIMQFHAVRLTSLLVEQLQHFTAI